MKVGMEFSKTKVTMEDGKIQTFYRIAPFTCGLSERGKMNLAAAVIFTTLMSCIFIIGAIVNP